MTLKLLRLNETPQQASCLVRSYSAELSGFRPRDPTVRLCVLQHHLFLLQRFEAPSAHIGRLLTQAPIRGSRQVIGAPVLP